MEDKYTCKYCGKEYPRANNFLRHLITKHGMTLETVRDEVGPEEQEKYKL